MDRTRRELSDEDVIRIAGTYRAWRGGLGAGHYEDVPGYCKAATLEQISEQDYVLTPGRYVGATAMETDDMPFEARFGELRETLDEQFATADELTELVQEKLNAVSQHG